MSEDADRSHFIVSITYAYEHGNENTRKFLVLNNLNTRNAIKYAMDFIPYDKVIYDIKIVPFKLPRIGSVAFELIDN